MNQRMFLAGGVVLLHVVALWALQAGLLHRAVEIVVPAQILSEFAPPPPPVEPPKPPSPARPQSLSRPLPSPPPSTPAPSTPAPDPKPVAVTQPPQTAPALRVAPIPTLAPPAASPPPPAKTELPSSSAAYLNNPAPAYPALSRRLGEQGKVVLRVLIGADGSAQQAEIQSSSGFERLDRAALATVRQWRFVPGKRGGVPEAMWYSVPISFVLD